MASTPIDVVFAVYDPGLTNVAPENKGLNTVKLVDSVPFYDLYSGEKIDADYIARGYNFLKPWEYALRPGMENGRATPSYVGYQSDASLIEARVSASIYDAVGKRVLAAIEEITQTVNDGTVTLQAGTFALKILVETAMPFCAPDVSKLISDVLAKYRELLRTHELEEELRRDAERQVAVAATADSDAW